MLYVGVVLVVIFSIWIPGTFLTLQNFQAILSGQATVAILAMALVIPATAGVYDLSVAQTMGFATVLLASLTNHSSLPIGVLAVIVVLACIPVGVINAVLVVRFRVMSMIATLATSSILLGLVIAISSNADILPKLPHSYVSIAIDKIGPFPILFVVMLVVAAVLWYMLDQTPAGRYFYATGYNARSARLSGVPTGRMMVISLLASATIAGIAGVLLLSTVGEADATQGPSYLLPAFAAVFLGATRVKNGRVNILGAIIALYVLAIGIQGLTLAGTSVWVNNVFYGVALAVAVAASGVGAPDPNRS